MLVPSKRLDISFLSQLQLKKLGYTQVDALDFSPKMLDLAKSRDIYRHYICDTVQLHPKNQIEDSKYL